VVLIERTSVVAEARRWIGTPYHHQACACGVGADCLGLVRGVYRALYGCEPELPPAYSPDWAEARREETLADAARRHLVHVPDCAFLPGDVLLFRWRAHLPAKHAAIAVTPHSMVHAHDGARVAEVSLNGWWRRHLAFVFSFPGITD